MTKWREIVRDLKPWVTAVVGGSAMTALELMIHSNLTQAEMRYGSDQFVAVTGLSLVVSAVLSLPTLLAMLAARWFTQEKPLWVKWAWVQGVQAVGAAATFGTILSLDWDVFTVTCAVCYPAVGAVVWHFHLRGTQASNR